MTNLDCNGRDRKFKDETGKRHGTLTVLHEVPSDTTAAKWRVRCDCGRVYDIFGGCLRQRQTCSKCRNRRHDMTHSDEHRIWIGMRHRCSNPNHTNYHNYGGRGIAVCERWQLFENFYADMGPRPSKRHSIDRIDGNKGYCPENCRWATQKEQLSHTSQTHTIEFNGKTQNLTTWARELGMSTLTLGARLQRGWSIERALTEPVKHKHNLTQQQTIG